MCYVCNFKKNEEMIIYWFIGTYITHIVQNTQPIMPTTNTQPASPTLNSAKDKSLKEGKALLKKMQTKINKKSAELKQLIEQQESSIKELRVQIQKEHERQESNKQTYDKAMQDIRNIQNQIQEAEAQFGNLQKEVDGKQRDVTESILILQSELQALQQETTDKHKTYEDSIQFFFSPNKSESTRWDCERAN